MNVKDLQVGQGKIDVVLTVTEKGDIREFEKFGKPGRVCNAKGKDESGEITLSLWNDDIDKVNVGDKIHIQNGYVSQWQGELQLSTGKFGTLEVVGSGSDAGESPAQEQTAEQPAEPKPNLIFPGYNNSNSFIIGKSLFQNL